MFLSFTLGAIGQNILMQNGTINQCGGTISDSGGLAGSYNDNENFTLTLCPDVADNIIQLAFTQFSTQQNADILTIYEGQDTTGTVIGTYSGGIANSPGNISANLTSTNGCITLAFTSDATGNTTGFAADISCTLKCQDITASIDATVPVALASGNIEIPVGTTVDFQGSGTFSDSAASAQYNWNFGEGAPANTANASHLYNTPGTYTVTFTVSDNNPTGCSGNQTITVLVLEPVITSNNPAFPQSRLSLPELVDQVLVSGGCSAVSDFSFQVFGAPGDLATKSYGYFTKGGAAGFPFDEGIVLSTGNASLAGNTVTAVRNDVNNGQGGDADLATALGGAPNLNDATFVKFSFVPTVDTINFRYLMASEEYDGSTECDFADGFAFLLREVGTAVYQNLAVLPDGTPVSVTNINNAISINPTATCTANIPFFEGYVVGQTNYNGRTKILTATANVIPGTTYEIKLVVADEGDSAWDSAIFLEAGSFNLGGDLGDDITIASGTAKCLGDTLTLDTQVDPTINHVWTFNGAVIAGENGSTIDVSAPGSYGVEVQFAASCLSNDTIEVEFITPAIVNNLDDLSQCSSNTTENFNLTVNTSEALGTQSNTDYMVSYHITQADADNDTGAITNPAMFPRYQWTNYLCKSGRYCYTKLFCYRYIYVKFKWYRSKYCW